MCHYFLLSCEYNNESVFKGGENKMGKKLTLLLSVCVMIAVTLSGIASIEAAAKINIKNTTVSISKVTYTYTGKAIKPNVKVKYKNTTLKKDRDYKVAYKNNKKVGLASITVTGLGKYKGTVTKKFKIRHSNKFNKVINFDNPKKIQDYYDISDEVPGLKVSVDKKNQIFSQRATVNGVKFTLKVNLQKYNNRTSASQIKTCTKLFWDCYPKMYKRFAVKGTPTTVNLRIENEGYEVAEAYANNVHIHDNWLNQYKNDYDCLTHEFAHVIQTEWDGNYVPSYGDDTYMIERFADYCRFVYAYNDGYYNDTEWDLQDSYSENHYSKGNRFWVWLDYKYSTKQVDIMKRIAKAINTKKDKYSAKNWNNNGKAWKEIFKGTKAEGKNLSQLWKEYTKDEFSRESSYAINYGEESMLIFRYDARNKIKNRK